MNIQPKSAPLEVSVALCTYNGDKFLRDQLDSILQQDYLYITDIVCVDDNSNDATWDILEEYTLKYKQIRIFKNTTNLGYVKNFERAITLTFNKFISISDQDDWWYPTKITKLVQAIGDKMLVYSDSEYIDLNGKAVGNKLSDNRNQTTVTSCLSFALFNGISGHTILFNRELLKFALPFNNEIPHDFWLGFFASQYSNILVVNEVLVGYRQHSANIIGAIGHKGGKKDSDAQRILNSQKRIAIFSQNLAPHLEMERKVFEILGKSYTDKSYRMRIKRVILFWKYNEALLLFKKRTKIRNLLYSIKAFWKYQ